MTNTAESFTCPYCGVFVKVTDKHAAVIEKKNIKDRVTIVVKCEIIRQFEITPRETT